jgi:DNA-binding transcriptional MerR regulator
MLTLPQVARLVGVEYRTLHSWLRRGLVKPSMQASSGTGIPNLFTQEDAVRAKIVADLRLHGVGFELLREAADRLSSHPAPLGSGTMVLVNGSVSVVDAERAAHAMMQESITVAYNTSHAVREIQAALSTA